MKNIAFAPGAYSDYLDWLKTDKKLFLKITDLIRECANNPYKGIGKPEALKHEYSGLWSRRINKEHRLIYKVTEETSTLKNLDIQEDDYSGCSMWQIKNKL